MRALTWARHWGSTPAERELAYPCDGLLPGSPGELFRAVNVQAPAETVFRWLCQLRVAPYSYDWIDNIGRHSPRQLTPGLENLEVGQRFMTAFTLVSFETPHHITIDIHPKFGPDTVMSYVVVSTGAVTSRLILKMLIAAAPAAIAPFAPIELVMARKQLQTVGRLATAAAAETRR